MFLVGMLGAVTLFDPDDPFGGSAETSPVAAPISGGVIEDGERRLVYTDGACSGNPGPGGWGWVIPRDSWASGAENPSTNQRMELLAVLHAVTHLEGRLEIVSDSTYVVNCFKDEWWVGWERRGWKNSQKKPVANQDLWKPLIDAVRHRDIEFRWVKGHAGNEWNDVADSLAVDAAAGGGSNGEIREL